MNRNWKRVIASLLVLALIAVLCVGCGKEAGEEVVITLGEITDFTGPASPATYAAHVAILDAVRYCNEEGLIPGVKIELVSFDTQYNPARDIPGYYWVRERGADIIFTNMASFAETVRPFSEQDKVPIVTSVATRPTVEPPGWTFCFNPPFADDLKTLLKWVSEEHWDYTKGTPRIGSAGWSEPIQIEMKKALSEYCQDHPDEFEYVGGFLAPIGTMTWSGEVEKLKDCDYVVGEWGGPHHFIEQFHERGYTATFVGGMTTAAFRALLVDTFGWELPLDGMFSTAMVPWWGEPVPMIELAEEVLHRYHDPGEAEDIVYEGVGYVGTFQGCYAILEILQAALEEVGAENFDGQAFYDAAVKYKSSGLLWEGYPGDWGFSETKRYWQNHEMIYEWSAEAEDLVSVSDWLPLVK